MFTLLQIAANTMQLAANTMQRAEYPSTPPTLKKERLQRIISANTELGLVSRKCQSMRAPDGQQKPLSNSAEENVPQQQTKVKFSETIQISPPAEHDTPKMPKSHPVIVHPNWLEKLFGEEKPYGTLGWTWSE